MGLLSNIYDSDTALNVLYSTRIHDSITELNSITKIEITHTHILCMVLICMCLRIYGKIVCIGWSNGFESCLQHFTIMLFICSFETFLGKII